MRMVLRWTGYVLAGLLLLVLLFAAWVWFTSARVFAAEHEGVEERLVEPTPAHLADAARQARILQCYSCHGEGLRGKLMFDAPNIAKVYAPNLPLLAAEASDEQLARAIRQGIGTDGRALFIMPSAQLSRLDDQTTAALIRHIRSLPRAGQKTPPVHIGPLGRLGIATGRFHSQVELVDQFNRDMPVDLGPATAAGRRRAMVSCAECHGSSLGGGSPGPGIEAPDLTMVGAYDLAAFRRLLRTGVSADGRKLDLMREVSLGGFRYMTDREIEDLHAYLVARAEKQVR